MASHSQMLKNRRQRQKMRKTMARAARLAKKQATQDTKGPGASPAQAKAP